MYIVTDGKNYVMKDPINAERWLVSTNINHAYVGSLKQAKRILRMKRFSPSKGFHMVDHDTGNTVPKEVENYRGSAGAFLGENEISLDDKILDEIFREARGILAAHSIIENTLRKMIDGEYSSELYTFGEYEIAKGVVGELFCTIRKSNEREVSYEE